MILYLFLILIVFLILALFWEYKDYFRLYARPNVNTLTSAQQQRELIFYGCFNYENKVEWRSILIGTILSTLLIWYILLQFRLDVSGNMIILIALSILGIFYILDTFKNFHLYRVMCSKIKPELTIL